MDDGSSVEQMTEWMEGERERGTEKEDRPGSSFLH